MCVCSGRYRIMHDRLAVPTHITRSKCSGICILNVAAVTNRINRLNVITNGKFRSNVVQVFYNPIHIRIHLGICQRRTVCMIGCTQNISARSVLVTGQIAISHNVLHVKGSCRVCVSNQSTDKSFVIGNITLCIAVFNRNNLSVKSYVVYKIGVCCANKGSSSSCLTAVYRSGKHGVGNFSICTNAGNKSSRSCIGFALYSRSILNVNVSKYAVNGCLRLIDVGGTRYSSSRLNVYHTKQSTDTDTLAIRTGRSRRYVRIHDSKILYNCLCTGLYVTENTDMVTLSAQINTRNRLAVSIKRSGKMFV